MNLAMKLGLGPKHEVLPNADGSVVVRVTSPSFCGGEVHDIPLTAKEYMGYLDWRCGGLLIQDALPHLSVDIREIFQSGIGPAKWEAMFGEDV
jgi:hypothetical protein